ncbi:MAG: hypothetical protein HY033_04360 [Ignavibacteriae bacterium]|nr:hypothetical protein [Ignavibacteria bacterium]MBI3364121.1 hypothetical protein [Ignavibacteriota bacterium]
MWKTTEGSTGRLIQLCVGYFIFYVITGISAKYFTPSGAAVCLNMEQIAYMAYNTLGGMVTALLVVLVKGWYKLRSNRMITVVGLSLPEEISYIIPSGFMTAIIIPATTLMYTFRGMSVMVAMVIMRASVIVISRLVDSVQGAQGILQKKVYKEENIAVGFALLAAGVNLFWVQPGDFDFLQNTAAVVILSSYIVAYAIRIYIMNYFKNTRAKGVPLDNNGFFGLEQIFAFISVMLLTILFFNAQDWFGWNASQVLLFKTSIVEPQPLWGWAVVSGTAFGIVAFFSVFLFMFKGRTATFAGLVNRLTSLAAGTVATLFSAFLLGAKFPKVHEWIALVFILVAVAFLSIAERKRTAELAKASTA